MGTAYLDNLIFFVQTSEEALSHLKVKLSEEKSGKKTTSKFEEADTDKSFFQIK